MGTKKKDTAKEMLERQIETEIQDLAVAEDGPGKKQKIEGLKDLYEIKIEEEEKKTSSRTKIIDSIVNGVQVVGSLALAAGFTIAGFMFEETGTFTSQSFRNWWQKFPTKR